MFPDAALPVPASLMTLLAVFSPLFTVPSFRTFCGLACGFLAQSRQRTVCGMLTGAGLSRAWSHDRAHYFFSRARSRSETRNGSNGYKGHNGSGAGRLGHRTLPRMSRQPALRRDDPQLTRPAWRRPRPLRPAGLHQARRYPAVTSPRPEPALLPPEPDDADLHLSVWPTAQCDARTQRSSSLIRSSGSSSCGSMRECCHTRGVLAAPCCGIARREVPKLEQIIRHRGSSYQARIMAALTA